MTTATVRRPGKREAASVLAYVPLTGPVPDGLKPGQTFIHESVRITAQLAEQLLDVNAPFNRPTSQVLEERWAAEILAGEWARKSPEGMTISSVGEMLDGQTRCGAVRRAAEIDPNVYITVDVHHNYDPDVYAILNRGRSRTAAHAVYGAGYPHSNNLAAMALLVSRYDRHFDRENPLPMAQWPKLRLSGPATVAYVNNNPDMVKSWKFAHPLRRVGMNGTVSGTALFLVRRATGMDETKLGVVDLFALGVADPVTAGCTPDDPRNAMYKALRRYKDQGRATTERHEVLGLFLRAWEMWCRGKGTTNLLWTPRSTMPEVHVPENWGKITQQWVRK